nr:LysR family transcriptional regulator [Thiocapsa sp.]
MRTFIQVARARHFGRAAESLCVTQSTVSARIKLLESTLGVTLFERRRNDIQPTPAGHRLLRHAENIVRSWAVARQELRQDVDHRAELAIGCQPELWPVCLRDWAGGLRRSRPDLALQVEIMPPEQLIQRIAADRLDLIALLDPPTNTELELEQVIKMPLTLVADRPGISVEQALGDGYLLVDWGSSFRIAHAKHFPRATATSTPVPQGLVAFDLIRLGGGAAYLPRRMVERAIESEELFPVEGAPVIDKVGFVAYRSGALDTALSEALSGLREVSS